MRPAVLRHHARPAARRGGALLALAAWSALDSIRPIGVIDSPYATKFGTPRQGALVPDGRARLRVTDCGGLDAALALDGLGAFSHVWLVWAATLNGHAAARAKVRAPRLRGGRAGLFATRTPFRPSPIGLTLCRLDGVRGDTLELSGVDLVAGTPVLDVKPYLPAYDAPPAGEAARAAAWVEDAQRPLEVAFAPAAAAALADGGALGAGRRLLRGGALRRALAQALAADPRPLYRWRREAAAGGAPAAYEAVLDGVRARCVFERGADGRERVTVVGVSEEGEEGE